MPPLRVPLTAGVVFGCAALAVAVVVGWVLPRSAARQVKEVGQAVLHVRDQMAALKDFSGTLQQAENGRAGFLNTGDQSFLEAYREATHEGSYSRLQALRRMICRKLRTLSI
jgi:CHASE3 domain sensor protein